MRKNGPPKKQSVGKTRPQDQKVLPLVACHMNDKVEVILFHIKSRCVQGLVFVEITFEKCTTSFCFENGEVAIKATITNLSPVLA